MSKLPKSLTTVTTFSKLLALCLIFAFIFSAFYAGILFDHLIPTSVVSAQTACQQDSDCILIAADTQNSCCPNTRCLDLSQSTTIAVNGKWVETQKSSTCGQHVMCPMIMAICPKEITQENAHYSAKCIQRICTKVKN